MHSPSGSIGFVTGPADFVNLFAFLTETGRRNEPLDLFVFGLKKHMPNSLVETTKLMFESKLNGSFEFLDLSDGTHVIREHPNTKKDYRTLFLTHAFGSSELEIVNSFSHEEAVLIENGIATYHPPFSRDKDLRRNYLKARPKFQITSTYLPLAPYLGRPFYLDQAQVGLADRECLVRVLEEFKMDFALNAFEGKTLFVAGTSLYRLKVISREAEISCYNLFIASALDKGFDNIVWKPHPRMGVSAAFSSLSDSRVTTVTHYFPLELMFLANTESKCASLASSSLHFAKYYFGLEVELIDAKFGDLQRHPHLHKLRTTLGQD